MFACTGQGSAGSQLPSSAGVAHGSCSMQRQESRLLQLPLEVFKQILEAACSDLSDGLHSQCLHALYSTCRPACHAMRQLIKHLKVDLDAPLTPVEEGLRQLALYPALNSLALIVHASSTAISDFMAGTKGTTARLTAVHKLSVITGQLYSVNTGGPYSVNRGQEDTSIEDIFNIVLALPSLRDVRLTGKALPRSVKPLHWLSGLTRLDLHGDPWGPGEHNDTYKDLGLLTGLQSLVIDCVEPRRLLPHLALLPKLSHLELNMSCPENLRPPGFISLPRHLTHLTFKLNTAPVYVEDMEQQTLDAICACTCLVKLNLKLFNITTTAAVLQLVAMPKLKHVVIYALPEVHELPDLQELMEPCECSWDSLEIGVSRCMRQLLAFSSVRRVEVGDAFWDLPGGGDAESVAEATAEVTAVAMVLARGGIEKLHLHWAQLPAVSCSSVIGGLAPLHQLGSLELVSWVIDKALLLQLSEALPQLASLTLGSRCIIKEGAWAAMHSLSCLTYLTVDCDVVHADVLAFAVATSGGLHMCVRTILNNPPLLQSYRRVIQEQREALGKPPVTLCSPTRFYLLGRDPAVGV